MRHALTAADAEEFSIGDMIEVEQFFWIDDDDLIGFDDDAEHGHVIDSGSVDIGCKLEIRGLSETHAVVRLHRPSIPYGAPAAIGTVFWIDLDTMRSWPQMAEARKAKAKM